MNSRDFVYWINGFFELSNTKTLNEKQVAIIKKHLAMVFVHDIDPSFGEYKDKLLVIHNTSSEDKGPLKPSIEIIINARKVTVVKEALTFEELVSIANIHLSFDCRVMYSVSNTDKFSFEDSKKYMYLNPGESVAVYPGMVFNITDSTPVFDFHNYYDDRRYSC